MEVMYGIDGLDLDHEFSLDKQIYPIAALELNILINQRQRLFLFNEQSGITKFEKNTPDTMIPEVRARASYEP